MKTFLSTHSWGEKEITAKHLKNLMKIKHLRKSPNQGIPVLRGFFNKNKRLIQVYCPMCDRILHHGWDPKTDPDWCITHRTSHCNCWPRGYYVGPFKKSQLKQFHYEE